MRKRKRRLIAWRILLGILIICNMAVVFLFSSQNGAASAAISQKVTIGVVEMVSKDTEATTPVEENTTNEPTSTTPPQQTEPPEETPDEPGDVGDEGTASADGTESQEPVTPPEEEPEEQVTAPAQEEKPKDPMEHLTPEQVALVNKAHTPIRKIAHMLEFGSLAALAFLFLLTWSGQAFWRYGAALGFALIYAATDELHQLFRAGRGARISDVVIDFTGAFITCTLLLTFVTVIRRTRRLVTTHHYLPITPNGKQLRIGLVADLHGCPFEKLVKRLRTESPDIILVAGDLMEDTDLADEKASGYAFLRACAEIAPTYYSFGNHETVGPRKKRKGALDVSEETRARIANTGATLLHDESVLWNGIRICGLTSGLTKTENHPNEAVLSEFAAAEEFRILICHHPEYYEPYIRSTNIELTVCGHAHGGQWRFFGRGVYAPGQGIFPKYTSGVIDGRCVISRGVGDHTRILRFCNPRELVVIGCGIENKAKPSIVDIVKKFIKKWRKKNGSCESHS